MHTSNPEITRDQKAFLKHYENTPYAGAFEAVLDDLIAWSLARAPALRFISRESQGHRQHTVSFYVPGIKGGLLDSLPLFDKEHQGDCIPERKLHRQDQVAFSRLPLSP